MTRYTLAEFVEQTRQRERDARFTLTLQHFLENSFID